jgi:putative ABC transport system substrate-binding protein
MQVKRRDFITLLGGAAAAWPVAARGQQPKMPVIGFLHTGAPEESATAVAAFRKGLSEVGFVEGQNLTIEYHWARFDRDRLPELAANLVRRQVSVIATPGNLSAALAAKASTSTIPIVFSSAGDPVQAGLVASLNRPGGNVTGSTSMNIEVGAKRLGLLHELLPKATRFAILVHPTNPNVEFLIREAQVATSATGGQLEVLYASTNREIDTAFTSLLQKRVDGLLLTSDIFLYSRRIQIVTLAVRHLVPAIYTSRAEAAAGGLFSYGAKESESDRQAGIYTGRVLKGEKPADLPVVRVTKFDLVINLQTARTLGIDVPPALLARADEVIE